MYLCENLIIKAKVMPTLIIPVNVPTIGTFSFQKLKEELTEYANVLVSQVNPTEVKRVDKAYSPRLMRLHKMSQNNILLSDMESDDRLTYLLSK